MKDEIPKKVGCGTNGEQMVNSLETPGWMVFDDEVWETLVLYRPENFHSAHKKRGHLSGDYGILVIFFIFYGDILL
jgi:hypothetical protein